MPSRAVVFDAIGTLFDLEPIRERLGAQTAEAWFERLLHSAATLSLVGAFEPFDELARTTLATTLARLERDDVDADDVVAALGALPAFPDAAGALAAVAESGASAYVLTNGGADSTARLLERAGLTDRVADVFSVEEVERYKPHPAPYRHVKARIGRASIEFVSAHAWDVLGARNARLDAVWVNRSERVWPFSTAHHEEAPDLTTAILA